MNIINAVEARLLSPFYFLKKLLYFYDFVWYNDKIKESNGVIMAKESKKNLRWARLDNAAKIYPAAMRRNWSCLYRQSVTLTEEVDREVLADALEVIVKRFPFIAARLRKGAFWFYLQQVEHAPEIKDEYSYPLVFMDKKELTRCAFRVIVYKKRIAVEYFHSLTDGTGALVFLKNLVAEYIERKYAVKIPLTDGIIDRNESPKESELEDSFLKYANGVPASRRDTNAWRMGDVRFEDGFLALTCLKVPVKDALALARSYGYSLTVFFSAVMMKALLELQRERTPNIKKQKHIKVLIPINLRSLFPSETMRNFAMYTIPDIDPKMGDYTLEEICSIVYHKMGLEFTAKHMSGVIAKNVGDERNPLVRLIPLPLKNFVMKTVYDISGECKSCLSFSNLGAIKLPEEMRGYIERFDFILGAQASAPYNCGMLSYGDTLYINFIRNVKDPGLERWFFKILHDLGLCVTVESNKEQEEE